MDGIFDTKPSVQAENELSLEAWEPFHNCVEQLRTPGGASIVDIYYGDDGSQAASRIRRPGSTEYQFKSGEQTYMLKEGRVPDAGLYIVHEDKEKGTSTYTPVETGSDEYNKASSVIRAIHFDALPRC